MSERIGLIFLGAASRSAQRSILTTLRLFSGQLMTWLIMCALRRSPTTLHRLRIATGRLLGPLGPQGLRAPLPMLPPAARAARRRVLVRTAPTAALKLKMTRPLVHSFRTSSASQKRAREAPTRRCSPRAVSPSRPPPSAARSSCRWSASRRRQPSRFLWASFPPQFLHPLLQFATTSPAASTRRRRRLISFESHTSAPISSIACKCCAKPTARRLACGAPLRWCSQ